MINKRTGRIDRTIDRTWAALRTWLTIVLAAVLTATGLHLLVLPAPTATAADAPTVYRMLGWNNKSYSPGDELRFDFVLKVAAGEDVTRLRYGFTPGAAPNTIATANTGATAFNLDVTNQYRVMDRINSGGHDYLAISVHGDADWPNTPCDASNLSGAAHTFNFDADTASGTATGSFVLRSHSPVANCATSRPMVATTFDNWWNSTAGTSQDGWGFDVGSAGLGTSVVPSGKVIIDAINPNHGNADPAKCGLTTKFHYQWVDQDNQPSLLTPTPVLVTGVTSHRDSESNVQVGTEAVENGASSGNAVGFPSTFDLGPDGPGYYKLMVWPVAESPQVGVNCGASSFDPTDIAQGWQVAGVFSDYSLPIPGPPAISVPADGALTNDTTPTIFGTSATPLGTITVTEGASTLCTATADAVGDWSCSATTLASGPHSITARATSTEGFVSEQSAVRDFTVDGDPPVSPVIATPVQDSTTADTTPQITGTGEAGASVEVREGALVLCAATVSGAGAWSCTSRLLTDGRHTITATQTDPAGNTGPGSVPRAFTVDTGAPAAPVISSPTNGSVTNVATPTISGSGEAAAEVTVTEGGLTLCTAVVSGAGTWTCTPGSPLSEGSHTVVATQVDPVGNVSPASLPVSFVIDLTAPAAVDITAPVDGSITRDSTPLISGAGEPGASLIVTEGGSTLCTLTVPVSGSWSCTPSALSDGLHTITATQTDPAGNASAPASDVSFTVDTTNPAAPVIQTPVDGTLTADATPTFTGSGEPGATVTLTEGATVVCTATVTGAGTWTCTPSSALAEGFHTVTATQADRAGNASSASNAVTLEVDTVAPDAPVITAPSHGGLISTSTPMIGGSGEPGAVVRVVEGGDTLCVATVAANGLWFCTSDSLADGDHTITATQVDRAGNVSPASAPSQFTVDTTAPDAPVFTAPELGSTIGDNTPEITGTGEPGATVTVVEAGAVICTAVVDPAGDWSCTPSTPLADGHHSLAATQEDAAGNVSGESSDLFAVDTVPPAAPEITAPASGSVLNTTTPVAVGTGEVGATVTVVEGGSTICTGVVDATGDWTCTPTTPLADGAHTWSARQVDAGGNTSSAAVPVTFVVDTALPSAPSITGPRDGSDLADATPEFVGLGEPGATVAVTEGGVVICTAVVDAAGNWACTPVVPLLDGDHTFVAVQTDTAGNISPASAPITVTIDTASPAAPVIDSPADGSEVADPTPRIDGSGEAGATVTVTEDGVTLCTAVVDSAGAWTCTPSSRLSEGEHTFLATQEDAAGNVSPTSAPVTITVDTTADVMVENSGIVSDVDGSGLKDVGDAIAWTATVTNTGRVPLTGVTATDRETGALTCDVSTLQPGEEATCRPARDRKVTQADLDRGTVSSIVDVQATASVPARVRARSAAGVVEDVDAAVVHLDQVTRLKVDKAGFLVDLNDDDRAQVGESVRWRIDVYNSGNTTLRRVNVFDPQADEVTCPGTRIAVGARMTCTVDRHRISESDAQRGWVANRAWAHAAGVEGDVESRSDVASLEVVEYTDVELPATGSPISPGLLGSGVLLLLAGLTLVLAGRRRTVS